MPLSSKRLKLEKDAMRLPGDLRLAVVLPCFNEELTLAKVIEDFRAQLPTAIIYVFDNGSTDRSAQIAKANGAIVKKVPQRGKGHVVRSMFENVDADIFVLVDSDDTYDAKGIGKLIEPVLSGEVDMMVASRLTDYSDGAFRRFHRLGNQLIQKLINILFRSQLTDICSGYRVMSKRFVKNIPLLRDGFEVETELTVHSLIYGFTVKEIPLPYRLRPPNSQSKLHTLRDGYRVLLTIVGLARDLRPLLFFATLGVILFFGVTLPMAHWWPENSFLLTTFTVLSVGLLLTGLVLNTINVRFAEIQALLRKQEILSPRSVSAKSSSRQPEIHGAA